MSFNATLASRAQGLSKSLIRQVFDEAAPGAINLGLGQPAIDPPPAVMERLEKAARDKKAAYTPNAGDSELRSRVGKELFDGAPLESVIITIGSEEAMFTALLGVLDPGDELLGPEPGYPLYRVSAGLVGASYRSYPLDFERGFTLDVDGLLASLTPRTRAVIITSPSNPTGRFAASPADMARLIAELEKRNVWAIDDCLYRDIAFAPHHGPLFRLGKNVLTIDAISKSFACTGLRVGWLQGPAEVMPKLIAIHQAVCTTAPTPSQEAAKTCLDLRGTGYLAEISALYAERARAACEGLRAEPRIRFAEPEGAFYLLADLRATGVDTRTLAFDLARRGQVITVPGEAFGPTAKGLLRVTFAPTPDLIRTGIERLLAGVAAARG
jgi:aspartate/methionine/tyrosine aminotransferase